MSFCLMDYEEVQDAREGAKKALKGVLTAAQLDQWIGNGNVGEIDTVAVSKPIHCPHCERRVLIGYTCK